MSTKTVTPTYLSITLWPEDCRIIPVYADSNWSMETHPPDKSVFLDCIDFCWPLDLQGHLVAFTNAQQAHIGKNTIFARCLDIRPILVNRFNVWKERWPIQMCHQRNSCCASVSGLCSFEHVFGSSLIVELTCLATWSGKGSFLVEWSGSNSTNSCRVKISKPSSSWICRSLFFVRETMKPLAVKICLQNIILRPK